jgi:hypothetical protein
MHPDSKKKPGSLHTAVVIHWEEGLLLELPGFLVLFFSLSLPPSTPPLLTKGCRHWGLGWKLPPSRQTTTGMAELLQGLNLNLHSYQALYKMHKNRTFPLAGLAAHSCNLSTQEAEIGGSWVQSQPGLHSNILSINKQTEELRFQRFCCVMQVEELQMLLVKEKNSIVFKDFSTCVLRLIFWLFHSFF